MAALSEENMTTIEAKVQSMYFFVDVVDALLDPNCILIIKIRSGLFLYNAMLDVEMRLPSLKDAACIWSMLESFQEIFTFAKDDLRQLKRIVGRRQQARVKKLSTWSCAV